MDSRDIAAVLAAPRPRLELLHLCGPMRGGAGAAIDLAAVATLAPRLETLDLRGVAFEALAAWPDKTAPCPRLGALRRELAASAGPEPLCQHGRHALARGQPAIGDFRELVELCLSGNLLVRAGAGALRCTNAHSFVFDTDPLPDRPASPGVRGCRWFASKPWPKLEVLGLTECGLRDAGLKALGRRGAWPALKYLKLFADGNPRRPAFVRREGRLRNVFRREPKLAAAQKWAPALEKVRSRRRHYFQELGPAPETTDDGSESDPVDDEYLF
jgi:hypothetical protein